VFYSALVVSDPNEQVNKIPAVFSGRIPAFFYLSTTIIHFRPHSTTFQTIKPFLGINLHKSEKQHTKQSPKNQGYMGSAAGCEDSCAK